MGIISLNLIPQAVHAVGLDSVIDSNWKQHDIVHAIEKPIQGIVQETKTLVTNTWNFSEGVMKIAVYWAGAWLTYTLLSEFMPSEMAAVERSVSRAFKRMRYE